MMYFDGRSDYARGRGRDRARGGGDRYPMEEEMMYDYADGEDYDYDMRRGGDREMDMRRRRSQTTGRYMRDRHKTEESKLPEEDIEKWTKSLLSELEDRDRQQLKMDTILKRAQDMGIQFEKFTPEEFYVTVVMLYSDLSKAMGAVSMDNWLKAAKAWLCDPDAALRYGKKLAAYYEEIVDGI